MFSSNNQIMFRHYQKKIEVYLPIRSYLSRYENFAFKFRPYFAIIDFL